MNFVGETYAVTDALTFGREADLELDTNPFLHRIAGEFRRESGQWWLHNRGSKLHVTMIAADGTRATLPPGARQAITTDGVARVTAGRVSYEVEYGLDDPACRSHDPPQPSGTMTVGLELELTAREIDFLVAFARPMLLGLGTPLPTYAEVATAWGVSPKTLDNALQSVKRKFRAAGLIRDPNLEALVMSAIQHSLVTRADLDFVDLDSGTPRSTAARDQLNTG